MWQRGSAPSSPFGEMRLDSGRPHFPLQSPAPLLADAPRASVGILAQDFRVVCDNMLQGLGRSLRCLGVDVRILGNDDEHRRAAEVGGRWVESARVGVGSSQGWWCRPHPGPGRATWAPVQPAGKSSTVERRAACSPSEDQKLKAEMSLVQPRSPHSCHSLLCLPWKDVLFPWRPANWPS